MVDPKPKVKQLTHLLVPRLCNIPPEKPVAWIVFTTELIQTTIDRSGFFEGLGSLDGLLPGMHEHHHLMALLDKLGDLFEGHSIEVPAGLCSVWLSFHADKVLFQWDRSERRVEKEKTGVAGDPE